MSRALPPDRRTPSPRRAPHGAWLYLCCCAAIAVARAQPAEAPAPERDLNQTLVVASSEVFFPYQFRDGNGPFRGFAVDITDAVARVMNLRLRRIGVANTDMARALRGGRVDFIQFWAETEERRHWAEFSVPVIGGIETVAVVRRDDRRFHTLADLDGKRVAVGQAGTVGWKYLTAEHPTATPYFTETSEQFLRAISAGKIDAAVMSRLTAATMIDRFGLKNLKVLEDRIPGGNYDVRYCFTVRRGDALLLARLNEGLAILHRTGEYDRIYHAWFGRYEARTFTPLELVSYVAGALAIACLAATWGFLRQRTLSRRIARQAAELAQERSILAALHDRHPLATLVFELPANEPARLVSANNEALRLFALEANALPAPLERLRVTPEIAAYFAQAVQRGRSAQQTDAWEEQLGGARQRLETTAISLGASESGVQRICILAGDVTRRRLMDQELAQSRRLRALGELVGGIAHEFNNLLTPIMMTTSEARLAPELSPEQRANFAMIDQAARRAADLTRRLLTFGRRSDSRAEPTQLASAVENCFALLRPTIDRRIELRADSGAALPDIAFNPTDLNQVVFNLVLNARDALVEKLAQRGPDASPWIPVLKVATRELAASARPTPANSAGRTLLAWQQLTVEDNGVGIPAEVIERIFEPFFTTKEVGRGTGLGLATVWHVVTEAGGAITVESQLGVGTKFHVWLPRWATAAPPAVRDGAARSLDTPAPGRVLLVEDEPLVSQAAVLALRHAGHVVVHATDGAAAWNILAGNPRGFDLLLADVNMPRLNGVDLVQRARGAAFEGQILMMTGRVSEMEQRTLHALGVNAILHKPFTGPELIAAVVAALRSKPAPVGGA